MTGSSWMSKVLSVTLRWAEGCKCIQLNAGKDLGRNSMFKIKPKHRMKKHWDTTKSGRIHCVPITSWNWSKALTVKKKHHICAECLPPCGQKTYCSVLSIKQWREGILNVMQGTLKRNWGKEVGFKTQPLNVTLGNINLDKLFFALMWMCRYLYILHSRLL